MALASGSRTGSRQGSKGCDINLFYDMLMQDLQNKPSFYSHRLPGLGLSISNGIAGSRKSNKKRGIRMNASGEVPHVL